MPNSAIQFTLDELTYINTTISELYNRLSKDESLDSFMLNTLAYLREQVYFDKGNFIMINYDKENDAHEVDAFTSLDWDKSDIDVYIQKYFDIDDVIPVLTREAPIAFRNNDLFSLKERKKTKYYREFVEPVSIQTSIDANIVLPEKFDTKLIMGVFRNPGKRNFSKKELEIIKIYQPHLSTLFTEFLNKTNTPSLQIMNMIETFDSLGICILDATGKIVTYNSAYRRFSSGGDLSALTTSPLTKQIQQYCYVLSTNEKYSEIFEPYIDDDPLNDDYIIEVSSQISNDAKLKYFALVYSVSEMFMFRFRKMREKYKLSSRESEILLLMIGKGMSAEDIGKTLFISISTVKKHISSAYRKMNINTQKELISLLKLV